MTDNVKRFPEAEARRQAEAAAKAEANKPPPPRPALDLQPFNAKDPNVIIARLERRLTVADDQLADAQQVITTLLTHIAAWEAWAGVEPATEPPTAS